jgi:hypothetical protein
MEFLPAKADFRSIRANYRRWNIKLIDEERMVMTGLIVNGIRFLCSFYE